jgi:hypothetical protein
MPPRKTSVGRLTEQMEAAKNNLPAPIDPGSLPDPTLATRLDVEQKILEALNREYPLSLAAVQGIAFEHVSFPQANEILNRLVTQGRIILVSSNHGSIIRSNIYPGGTSFRIDPAGSIVHPTPNHLPILSAEGQQLLRSIEGMLDLAPTEVALHLIWRYCTRCGAKSENHYCTAETK